MTVRAVVSDLDGTLLRGDGSLADVSRAAIAAWCDAGGVFVAATARSHRALRLVHGYEALGVVLCSNGSAVFDAATGDVVRSEGFTAAEVAAVLDAVTSAVDGSEWALDRVADYIATAGYVQLRPGGATGVTVVGGPGDVADGDVLNIAIRHPSMTTEELTAAVTSACGPEVTISSAAWNPVVDLSPPGVTKAAAAERLLAEVGIGAAEVVAVGDMPNDIPLLAWAGRGVAVANAHPAVLAVADEVIGTNEQDAVASLLRRLTEKLTRAAPDAAPAP